VVTQPAEETYASDPDPDSALRSYLDLGPVEKTPPPRWCRTPSNRSGPTGGVSPSRKCVP